MGGEVEGGEGCDDAAEAGEVLVEFLAVVAAELALEVKGDNANAVLQALKQARPSAVLLLTAGTSSLSMIQGIKQQLPGVLAEAELLKAFPPPLTRTAAPPPIIAEF